jgi:glyoxylase-like metal-dependent hydrolase (beta-lactamase superfamily II)
MKVHHLNCATMCPHGARLFTGEGGLLERHRLVAHCLLIEAGERLVLVDTGLGSGDVADPRRLGAFFTMVVRPEARDEEPAVKRIAALGLDPADVTDVVCTHLDGDHAGGLPDFPDALVHVFRPEMEAALKPAPMERLRYVGEHFAHGPRWEPHDVAGDEWEGFEAVRAIEGVDAEILIVPLVGHTRGHSAVAVRDGDGWLLHCGDGYFHRDTLQTPPRTPPGFRAFENIVGLKRRQRLANQERLRELVGRAGERVRPFCAHDPVELGRCGEATPPAVS